jgi:trehalose 6-phosphate synthase
MARSRSDASARQRIIFVSNRGPIQHVAAPGGRPIAGPGAGGVVSGLLCAAGQRPLTWIALAMTDAERAAAHAGTVLPAGAPAHLSHLDLHLVDVPPATYRRHYDGISNRVLWFAQHYLMRPTTRGVFSNRTHADWERGYRAVNAAVADEVVRTLRACGTATPVLFQDYHLYLAPRSVRERCPEARLQHFIHIPWPDARYWEMLPEYMAQEIYQGLLANDCVSLQTHRDAHNFVEGIARFAPEAEVAGPDALGAYTVCYHGRRLSVSAHPIALTPDDVWRAAETPDAHAHAGRIVERLALTEDHQLILRVDRVEPTKNIVRGFQAYARLLRDHPELRGHVTFLALLVPSRQSVGRYRTCARQVQQTIQRINARYGDGTWQPIVAIYGNDRARALACMKRYDVLLVNPLIDGMNLVAKEGGLLNLRSGVLVLSRTVGVYEQLGEHAVGVAPLDVRATADALYQALTMPAFERRLRARNAHAVLRQESASSWLHAQLDDLDRVSPAPIAAHQPHLPRFAATPLPPRLGVEVPTITLPALRS